MSEQWKINNGVWLTRFHNDFECDQKMEFSNWTQLFYFRIENKDLFSYPSGWKYENDILVIDSM